MRGEAKPESGMSGTMVTVLMLACRILAWPYQRKIGCVRDPAMILMVGWVYGELMGAGVGGGRADGGA